MYMLLILKTRTRLMDACFPHEGLEERAAEAAAYCHEKTCVCHHKCTCPSKGDGKHCLTCCLDHCTALDIVAVGTAN